MKIIGGDLNDAITKNKGNHEEKTKQNNTELMK
jgi:hypothetical protein